MIVFPLVGRLEVTFGVFVKGVDVGCCVSFGLLSL